MVSHLTHHPSAQAHCITLLTVRYLMDIFMIRNSRLIGMMKNVYSCTSVLSDLIFVFYIFLVIQLNDS